MKKFEEVSGRWSVNREVYEPRLTGYCEDYLVYMFKQGSPSCVELITTSTISKTYRTIRFRNSHIIILPRQLDLDETFLEAAATFLIEQLSKCIST